MARGRGGPRRGNGGRMQPQPKTRPHPALLITESLIAWVLVDGRPVTVYGRTESADGRKKAGKIVAREGLEFAIGFRDERGSGAMAVAVDVVVDGVVSKADREIFRPDSFNSSQLTYTWRGRKDTSGTIRHFLFKPLALTDDADLACEDERVVKSIGTIQLRISRIKVTGEVAQAEPEFNNSEPPTLHEMSKKARVSHQAGLGPAQPHVGSSRSTFDWIDPPEQPFVIFEFSYLSRTLLELEGIIPPEPIAAPPAAAPAAAVERKPRRPSASSSSPAGTPPPRSSIKPRPSKRRDTSAEAVSAMLLRSSPEAPKVADAAAGPVINVRGAANERERLEKLEQENREMKAELERLRRGRLQEAEEEKEAKRRKSASVEGKRRKEELKGKGKAKQVEELLILDSDSD